MVWVIIVGNALRYNLHIPFVGMLKECAKKVFNVEAEMKVLEIKHEHIEKAKFREQAIFEVTLDAAAQAELDEIYRLANEEKQSNTDHMDNKDNIQLEPEAFLRAMPYTTIFDKNMMIRSRGLSMKTLCPATFKKGACFNILFKLVMPLLPLTYDIAYEHRDCMVLLSFNEPPTEKDIEAEMMYFKGKIRKNVREECTSRLRHG